MPTKLKNLEVTSVDFVDAGANPLAKISIFKKADVEKNSSENVISKLAKSTGVSEKDFTDALISSLTAAVEKFQKSDEINQPAVNDDEKEDEPIVDNPDDDPEKKVDEEFKKSDEKTEENSMNENDLRKKLDAVQLAVIDATAGSENPNLTVTPTVEEKSVEKSVEKSADDKTEETADLTKALAQVVKNLQSKVEKVEDKEFVELAKKYEVLGLKAEELAPMFSEVGKRCAGFVGDARTQVEKITSEIRKNNHDLRAAF